jgi:hypothetical protein
MYINKPIAATEIKMKIRRGIKSTDRFIDKHLLVTEKNVDDFFNKCIKKLPQQFLKCWSEFYDNKEGKVSGYFKLECYSRREIDYSNCYNIIFFRLFFILFSAAALGILLYLNMTLNFLLYCFLGYVLLYSILSSLYYMGVYHSENKYYEKVNDFLKMLDRFFRLKPNLIRSLDNYLMEKPIQPKINTEKPAETLNASAISTEKIN